MRDLNPRDPWGPTRFRDGDRVSQRYRDVPDYPWQTHLRGVVGHVVLGVATHLTLEALEEA
jgi:hypothetical protein